MSFLNMITFAGIFFNFDKTFVQNMHILKYLIEMQHNTINHNIKSH